MPIKSVKMKISKNKKMRFFLMFQGSLNPKIRFLTQKLWSVARVQTHTQTDAKVNTEGTLSGFQDFFLQPVIKDWPKKSARFSCHNNKSLKLNNLPGHLYSTNNVFLPSLLSCYFVCKRVKKKEK